MVRFLRSSLLVVTAMVPLMAQTPPTSDAAVPAASLPPHGEARRLGPAPKAEASFRDGVWTAGTAAITTPLPVGYPRPTAPGELVIKTYPSIRKAEVRGAAMPTVGRNVGFWKLFEHIKKNDIAMTSPVEMEYPGLKPGGEMSSSAWSMAFLYRTSDMGKVGSDGDVVVTDTEPLSVLSLGVQGGYGLDLAREVLPALNAELAKRGDLEIAGPVRVLHYNGPDVPSSRKWSEVQLPVRKKAVPSGEKSGSN